MLSAKTSAFWIGCLGIFFLLNACEDKKDPYPGFSKMVGERQEVRESISKQKQSEKNQVSDVQDKKEEKSDAASTVIKERQIEIIDSVSGETIAKGVAYVDKDGKITRVTLYQK
ncbi:MAG: hypothetical protein ABR534_01780 [Desulfotignum sp.]|nr:hypothetical protein [Desulfobacteraceae bacterium]